MITISADPINAEKSNNVYLLFGWEAIQARPNLDPYTSALRTNDETMQVYTSDVHLKHHVRRGMKAFAGSGELQALSGYKDKGGVEGAIFYEKNDDFGNARSFQERLTEVRNAHDIENPGARDALHHCLDLPLFGYVHAVTGENFNVTNAANTLFRPATFHSCSILPLGRNNAFPAPGKESAGSATVDSLEYGFFLALWEINLNLLRINAAEHQVVKWGDADGHAPWLEALINGMWQAYSTERYPSFTQRSQFAQFVVGWQPADPAAVSYANPQDLYHSLPEPKQLKTHDAAVAALDGLLPDFLHGWGCTADTRFVSQTAGNCQLASL